MLNRYLQFTHRQGASRTNAAADVASARHSTVDRARVVWPTITAKNKQSTSGPSRLRALEGEQRVAQDRLVPLLGASEYFAQLRAHRDRPDVTEGEIDIRVIMRKVRVGNYSYDFKDREVQRRLQKTCASWFRIRATDVPNYAHDAKSDPIAAGDARIQHKCEVALKAYTIDPYLYGRITRFVQVTVPQWNNGAAYQLAQVELFKSHQAAEYTNLRHINVLDVVQYAHPRTGAMVPIEYVHVKHLDSAIALASFGRPPPHRYPEADGIDQVSKRRAVWKYVLPIEHDEGDSAAPAIDADGDPVDS